MTNQYKNSLVRALMVSVCLVAVDVAFLSAQEKAPSAKTTDQRFQRFTETMSNVALVGHFTITGQNDKPLNEERYEISSVKKMSRGDYWLFQARIKYGKHDVNLPLPLQVKWAGNTPVITLDNVAIPLLGTFNARVIIDGDRYAGTWQHGEVGGHLFGTIQSGPTKDDSE